MKFCSDCKHLVGDECWAKAYPDTRDDLVRGRQYVVDGTLKAREARHIQGADWACGPEGKLFKPTLMGRFRMWLREP